jgi:hypothetical protein
VSNNLVESKVENLPNKSRGHIKKYPPAACITGGVEPAVEELLEKDGFLRSIHM